jgi:hypothetical protein
MAGRERRAEAEAWGPPPSGDPAGDDLLVPTPRAQFEGAVYVGEGPVRVGFGLNSDGSPVGPFIAYGGRYVIPREFAVMFDPGSPAPKVFLRVVVDEQRRAEVLELLVLRRPEGSPVSGAALREIPVDRILTDAMEEAAFEAVVGEDGAPKVVRVKDRPGAGAGLFSAYREATGKPRKQRVTTSRLREVAEVYRVASTTKRGRPKQAVAEAFHVSSSTASRWIRTARERGLLGEAIPGRAGEREPNRKET